MHWITKWNEPFFNTPQDAEAYVTRELVSSVPSGWRVSRDASEGLSWTIAKEKLEADEWPNKCFGVRVAKGLDVVILTHGNMDVGRIALHHVLETALVIQAVALRGFKLAECIAFLFANCKPNEYGYT